MHKVDEYLNDKFVNKSFHFAEFVKFYIERQWDSVSEPFRFQTLIGM